MCSSPYRVRRFDTNPIITPDMDDRIGSNINGPSLIRVPDWVDQPLGRYYLYFANHGGTYIRLAYADQLEGPWRIHTPGVLDLSDAQFNHHIASPDVHVIHDCQEIRMYFHGCSRPGPPPGQPTKLAVSTDGLHFSVNHEILGLSYFRVFQYDGWFYSLEMPGRVRRSRDAGSGFEEGPLLFSKAMRHSAVKVEGDTLHVFYSNKGDHPERIVHSTIDLREDWMDWSPSEPQTLLQCEHDYEGADCPCDPSQGGKIEHRVHQLRDPCIFEEDGRTYLLYSIAGEHGIAMAELLHPHGVHSAVSEV